MNRKGFSLIEIIAVVIIIGIVAIIVVPSVSDYINKSKDTTFATYEKTMEEAAKNQTLKCIEDNIECNLPEKKN